MKSCLVILVLCACLVFGLRACHHAPAPVAKAPVAVQAQVRSDSARPARSERQQANDYLTAIAAQSDPAKLATLSSRAANPRLKRIMYWLAVARDQGQDPGTVIDQAQKANGSSGTPRAPLVKASLLRNLKICDGLGLLTPENRERMRRGNAPYITRGPYVGQIAEVDHIVPRAHCPETDNELANLELLPEKLNRAKAAKVGERQLAVATKFREVGLISEATMANVQAAFKPSGTVKYELAEP